MIGKNEIEKIERALGYGPDVDDAISQAIAELYSAYGEDMTVDLLFLRSRDRLQNIRKAQNRLRFHDTADLLGIVDREVSEPYQFTEIDPDVFRQAMDGAPDSIITTVCAIYSVVQSGERADAERCAVARGCKPASWRPLRANLARWIETRKNERFYSVPTSLPVSWPKRTDVTSVPCWHRWKAPDAVFRPIGDGGAARFRMDSADRWGDAIAAALTAPKPDSPITLAIREAYQELRPTVRPVDYRTTPAVSPIPLESRRWFDNPRPMEWTGCDNDELEFSR